MRLVNAACLILAELLSLRKEGLCPNQINKLLHKKETLFNPEILSLSKFKLYVEKNKEKRQKGILIRISLLKVSGF